MAKHNITAFQTLLDSVVDVDQLIECLTNIHMKFAEMRLQYPDTINTEDAEHLYFLRTVIETLKEVEVTSRK